MTSSTTNPPVDNRTIDDHTIDDRTIDDRTIDDRAVDDRAARDRAQENQAQEARPGPSSADPARGWAEAEAHILEQVASLTMWEAERWAAAYEHQLPRISLMAHRVSYLQAAGGSPELDYLLGAFARIDAAVVASSWAQPFGEPLAQHERVGDRSLAVTETMAAVNAVARYAITAVVITDEHVLPASQT